MKTIVLLRGLPGAGKTTLAKMICNQRFEADMFFEQDGEYKFDATKIKEAHAWCQEKVDYTMSQGYNVVVSNTFTQEWEMEPYYEMAKKYGFQVHSVIVENRHGGVNEHNVPEDKLQQMKDRFQVKL
jgi:predicted kinase